MTSDKVPPKVVALRGGEILPPGQPNPVVIAEIEELLVRARSGNLRGFVAVLLDAEDCTMTRMAGLISRGLLGAVEVAKHRLLMRLEE